MIVQEVYDWAEGVGSAKDDEIWQIGERGTEDNYIESYLLSLFMNDLQFELRPWLDSRGYKADDYDIEQISWEDRFTYKYFIQPEAKAIQLIAKAYVNGKIKRGKFKEFADLMIIKNYNKWDSKDDEDNWWRELDINGSNPNLWTNVRERLNYELEKMGFNSFEEIGKK